MSRPSAKDVMLLEIRVDLAPLRDGRYDVERHQFVTHLAEVLITGIEFGILLWGALGYLESSALGGASWPS